MPINIKSIRIAFQAGEDEAYEVAQKLEVPKYGDIIDMEYAARGHGCEGAVEDTSSQLHAFSHRVVEVLREKYEKNKTLPNTVVNRATADAYIAGTLSGVTKRLKESPDMIPPEYDSDYEPGDVSENMVTESFSSVLPQEKMIELLNRIRATVKKFKEENDPGGKQEEQPDEDDVKWQNFRKDILGA